jgi:hypothetical protein
MPRFFVVAALFHNMPKKFEKKEKIA